MIDAIKSFLTRLRAPDTGLNPPGLLQRVGGVTGFDTAEVCLLEEVSPSRNPTAVTVSDVTEYYGMKGFRVGGAGNLTLTLHDGTDVVITGALAGEHFPINCKKFKAATTATNITAYL
jgi:hypothetical protein